MQKSSVGPKLLLQLTIRVGPYDDTVPDEQFWQGFDQTCMVKEQQRYDAKGRQIAKGKNYSIEFDNYVTICVYDPNNEVLQIKETLSQISNLDMMKINFRNQHNMNKKQQQTDQQLRPILKRKNSPHPNILR
ncbi:unnamed protein product (macronuclear) [Paramecium tetraurelia]|uniref:Uncharacterized protein n=1 Tax=Paramecium tetraurelia TaxID=5888 RepID=A0DZH0_PARTE|nr:uncharacterized protein GSPATT00021604001 [Paramecium tetraurelia]CAK88437.1 unnamed protein product [Paramecium tetraurelia]|eukprot:XP_001455834.1 hypothetical protein (macronuclear) [Paramecium tetraurelia strain d4-2]